ncbi:YbaB/EbfC family nucleoid-associated protein [Actinoplanes sp. NPDC049118]|uniref:YbaB/EbfC family nucleoid-associated protein n=1 Tax=Actinoplanes sp. NPDC049118 TaxID=3155769 RepID=UPI003409FD37
MAAGLSDEGGILDPDGAREYLRGWKGRVDRMAVDAKAVSERLGQLRVTAEDANAIAEVTIDSTGALVDIRFSERIQHAQPDVVSRAVMSAVREARSNAADRSRQIVLDIMGGESVAARAIAERMAEQLRGPDAGGAKHGLEG